MTVVASHDPKRIACGCPGWCGGSHPITDEGVYHCAEVGRIATGELALVVSVAHWVPDNGDDTGPTITLSWEGIGDEAGYVHLLEGIELNPAEAVALIPLLTKANAILRTAERNR